MQRIAIIGCSGSGKSTLARGLGSLLGLPVVHIDAIYWRPGWRESEEAPFQAALNAAAARDRWIIDGTFVGHSAVRFARADTIIWLDLPTPLCLSRAFFRMASAFGQVRPDLAPGCPEKFDPAFYRYILNWNRDIRPGVEAAIAQHAEPARLVRLRSDREMAAFLANVEA